MESHRGLRDAAVRRAHALVEAERVSRLDFRTVAHDGHLVQARLAVEEHAVVVAQVPLHDVADLELARQHAPVVLAQVDQRPVNSARKYITKGGPNSKT